MIYQMVSHSGAGLFATRMPAGIFSALGGFDLRFTNSDHHVNQMIVGGVTSGRSLEDYDSYLIGLSDGDSNDPLGSGDPISAWAKWVNLGARPTFAASGRSNGRGRATVRIPELNDDELFVLRGFSIMGARGRNHHLRQLGVRHLRRSHSIEVSFADDSAGDDSFSFSVLYTVVQHARLTGTRITPHFFGPFSTTFVFTEQTTTPKPVRGFSLLSGFHFEFDDHDHQFRRITIDPVSHTAFEVWFTDDERDNRVSASLDYVLMMGYIA
ncbi:MAG: hypothetical protein KDG50_00650 [Chromatiales bacterium]|nr:hypothetical protein [Chromatiales bacterium]